jgi:hypothetical protein
MNLSDALFLLAAIFAAMPARAEPRPAAASATAPVMATTRPTDPDLIAWWRADRATAGETVDLAGHHSAKPVSGKITIETVDNHSALRFSKDSRELSAGTDAAFDFTADFTVALRVKLASDTGDVILLSKRSDNGSDGWAVVHGIHGQGGLGFVAAPRVFVPTPCKALSDWVHVAITFRQKDFLLYIDGKAIGVMELPTMPPGSKAPLLIGAGAGGKHPMDGWLDDIRIYHRGLTAEEVETLAAGKEPASPYPPLSAADEKQARDAIRELGADSYARREQAAEKLKAMGRKIFPLLRKYRDTEDLEVSLRIKALLGELPRAEADK